MKIAYLILAHENPFQLKSLVNALNMSNSKCYIHIDKRASLLDFKTVCDKLDVNVLFILNREKCIWGGLELVKATLSLLRAAQNDECDYFILMSGSDYPIKNGDYIYSFFEQHKGYNFIEFSKLPVLTLNYGGLDRVEAYSHTFIHTRYTHIPPRYKPKLNLNGHILNMLLGSLTVFKGKRKKPSRINEFYYGSQWWMLYKDTVKYIMNFVDENPDYLKFHQHTLIPDEIFFQTILLNAEENIQFKIVNKNYRYMIWEENSNHPKILVKRDIHKLYETDALFARKFLYDDG
jgi:hypothetical protein